MTAPPTQDSAVTDGGQPPPTSDDVCRMARDIGFDLCGVASVRPAPEDAVRLRRWIDAGYHAGMDYMARSADARADPERVMGGVRSIVCCAVNYNTAHSKSIESRETGRGWISRYAWGDDYHDVLRGMLGDLGRRLEEACAPRPIRWRACVDTAPLPERTLAARVGLGWIGKNGALIDRRLGSYLVLGELLVDLDLPQDESPAPAAPDRGETPCGDCRFCLDECPSGALVAPGVVDARRCASYLTIEHKGNFTPEQAAAIGDNVFGCDVCQDVCPCNSKIPATDRREFQPRPGAFRPRLEDLESLDDAEFERRFAGTALERCGLGRLRRNVAAVRRNQATTPDQLANEADEG